MLACEETTKLAAERGGDGKDLQLWRCWEWMLNSSEFLYLSLAVCHNLTLVCPLESFKNAMTRSPGHLTHPGLLKCQLRDLRVSCNFHVKCFVVIIDVLRQYSLLHFRFLLDVGNKRFLCFSLFNATPISHSSRTKVCSSDFAGYEVLVIRFFVHSLTGTDRLLYVKVVSSLACQWRRRFSQILIPFPGFLLTRKH
jgi:hypothetical protein